MVTPSAKPALKSRSTFNVTAPRVELISRLLAPSLRANISLPDKSLPWFTPAVFNPRATPLVSSTFNAPVVMIELAVSNTNSPALRVSALSAALTTFELLVNVPPLVPPLVVMTTPVPPLPFDAVKIAFCKVKSWSVVI